jgi:hypothetical protein
MKTMRMVVTLTLVFTFVFALILLVLYALVFDAFFLRFAMAFCLSPGVPLFGQAWDRFFLDALKFLTGPARFLCPSDSSGNDSSGVFGLLAISSVIWGSVVGVAFYAVLEMLPKIKRLPGDGNAKRPDEPR